MVRQALLIGVPEYKSELIHDLPVVKDDLRLLAAALRESEFEVELVGLRGREETGRSDLLQRISKACKESAAETLLIYFSGHGLHFEGVDYLIPADADAHDADLLKEYLIPANLKQFIDKCDARTVILVMDACRDGMKLEGKSVGLSNWNIYEQNWARERELVVLYSCSSGEYSYFVEGELSFSLFTKAFSGAMSPSCEANTIEGVIKETQRRLDELSAEHDRPAQRVKQLIEDDAAGTIRARVICDPEPELETDAEAEAEKPRGLGKTARQSAIFQAGTPMQMPPLPKHFVARPEHSELVKGMLLCDEPEPAGTLVVSAIYGLGGIGKSVIAAALCHDAEVQAQFPDGILWVTLGQQPDLQASLGGWIQALRDFDYKPTTVEAASTHLRTLLHNKQVLLVVDDAWQSDHVVPFQIGGAGCRVLVTTREAVIPDAERYDLDVMKEGQALELLESYSRGAMGPQEQEEAMAFAKAVGYLPLALELAAAQVADGFSWAELLGEFDREVAELELLDSPEVQDYQHEEKRKRLSLRACFNLSLQRLSRERLAQFAWLGVLPEDVMITADMAATLWGLSRIQAKKLLMLFKNRALLMVSSISLEKERTYQIHDLVHNTARWLLSKSKSRDKSEPISGLGLRWDLAQQQFINKFRAKITRDEWWNLEDDGYIHRYLTWHLEKAGLFSEIYSLLIASNENGRNAWYEACCSLGKPDIFAQNVARAWQLLKIQHDEIQSPERIQLIIRYATINATLRSVASKLSAVQVSELLRQSIWSKQQVYSHILRCDDNYVAVEIIKKIADILPVSCLSELVEVADSINSKVWRFKAISALSCKYSDLEKTDCLTLRNRVLEEFEEFENDNDQFLSAIVSVSKISPKYIVMGIERIDFVDELYGEDSHVYGDFFNKVAEVVPEEDLEYFIRIAEYCSEPYEIALMYARLSRRYPGYIQKALEYAEESSSEETKARVFATTADTCKDSLSELRKLWTDSNQIDRAEIFEIIYKNSVETAVDLLRSDLFDADYLGESEKILMASDCDPKKLFDFYLTSNQISDLNDFRELVNSISVFDTSNIKRKFYDSHQRSKKKYLCFDALKDILKNKFIGEEEFLDYVEYGLSKGTIRTYQVWGCVEFLSSPKIIVLFDLISEFCESSELQSIALRITRYFPDLTDYLFSVSAFESPIKTGNLLCLAYSTRQPRADNRLIELAETMIKESSSSREKLVLLSGLRNWKGIEYTDIVDWMNDVFDQEKEYDFSLYLPALIEKDPNLLEAALDSINPNKNELEFIEFLRRISSFVPDTCRDRILTEILTLDFLSSQVEALVALSNEFPYLKSKAQAIASLAEHSNGEYFESQLALLDVFPENWPNVLSSLKEDDLWSIENLSRLLYKIPENSLCMEDFCEIIYSISNQKRDSFLDDMKQLFRASKKENLSLLQRSTESIYSVCTQWL